MASCPSVPAELNSLSSVVAILDALVSGVAGCLEKQSGHFHWGVRGGEGEVISHMLIRWLFFFFYSGNYQSAL